jgi:two-component system NtrC family sensor kinase
MKRFICCLLVFCFMAHTSAQNIFSDSLERLLAGEKEDTSRVMLLAELAASYAHSKTDTALLLAHQGLILARQTKFIRGQAYSLYRTGYVLANAGNYANALDIFLQAQKMAESITDQLLLCRINSSIADVYNYLGDYEQSNVYIFKAKEIAEALHDNGWTVNCLFNLGINYDKLNWLDSAFMYLHHANELVLNLGNGGDKEDGIGVISNILGNIYFKKGEDSLAMKYYRKSVDIYRLSRNYTYMCEPLLGLAKIFKKAGKVDSALYYATLSLHSSQKYTTPDEVLNASIFLTDYNKAINKTDSAFSYQQITIATKNNMLSLAKKNLLQSFAHEEELRKEELAEQKKQLEGKVRLYVLLAALLIFLIIAWMLWRNNLQRRKAYTSLQKQKKETDLQKEKAENALDELKYAQKQLVQSEKMASLGELTAGIAHEIQNPLNFVNNFSEVSNELIVEMVEEVDKGNTEEVKLIANDIRQNLEKINHHGKRADTIVKNMLQHSRSGTGVKEPTDINSLADEYVRLAYHGLRAKDEDFKATIKTDFDESIGKINITPQDIGRVLLNLYNNAFYAVNEKKKSAGSGLPAGQAGYDPTVSITTKKTDNKITIAVKDNGNGIPQKIIDKIFQPFFTTKPTGQGTGLGLSLSYDVIKAYGGEIKVSTNENEGSEFIIELPFSEKGFVL